ncbi:MAG: hypothetical protein R3A46_10565 [Thermomicrobiales bacterium]
MKTDPGWDYYQIDACHDVMVTEPEMLARMLMDVVARVPTKAGR